MLLRITISSRIFLSILLAVTAFGLNSGSTRTKTTVVSPTTISTRSPRKPRALTSRPLVVSSRRVFKCPSSAVERHRNKIIRLGVILPVSGPYEWRMNKVRPAVEHARDYILQETDMLRNYSIEFEYRDSKCSEVIGPLEAIDMYTTKSVDVFVGPACEYAVAPIARFSYAWEIPILTAGALVNSLGEKTMYKLLTRVMGDYRKAGEFVFTVLQKFQYKTVGMMLHTNEDESKGKSECWFRVEALFLVLKSRLMPDLELKDVEFFDENRPPLNFEKNLKMLSQKCRGMLEKNS